MKALRLVHRVAVLGAIVLAGCASVEERQSLETRRRMATETDGAPRTDASDPSRRPALAEGSQLGDYLRYAAFSNPGLKAAFERWEAALERVPQVTSLPDPRFTYAYFIDRVETRVGPQRHRVGVAQMFPWFGKLRLRGEMALAEADAAYQKFEAARLELSYQVADAYFELYYVTRAIAITKENMALVKHLEGVARSQFRVGGAQHAHLIQVQVELGKLEDRLRTLTDLRDPITARLNAALNRPPNAPVPWPESVVERPVGAEDEQLLRWLRESSPELQALAERIAKELAAVDLARKEYYPDVTFGLDYIDTGRSRMDTPDRGKDPLIAMVSVNLPLWRGKYEAGEEEARARLRVAQETLIDRSNVLSARLKLVLFKYRDSQRKIDLYRDTLIPKAEQSLRATETAYKAGKADFLNLIDAERMLLHFRLESERALANSAQRLAELEMLVGRELPRE